MDIQTIITFTFIASVMVIAPGPNMALLFKTVTCRGTKHGYANILGICTAYYLHASLSIFGLSSLLEKSPNLFFIIKILGAIYLAFLGGKALFLALQSTGDLITTRTDLYLNNKFMKLHSGYAEGFFTNLLNPNVVIFYLAAFPQFINTSESIILPSYILVTIHVFLAILVYTTLIIFLGKSIILFKSQRSHAILQSLFASILIWFSYSILINS
jgi:threonine/homoserine/homoserine lactone efflux protein